MHRVEDLVSNSPSLWHGDPFLLRIRVSPISPLAGTIPLTQPSPDAGKDGQEEGPSLWRE